jgi:hypothetical protein
MKMRPRNTLEKVYCVLDALQPDENGCLIWPGAQSHGYGQFCINYQEYYVHRLALERRLGRPIKSDCGVFHTCKNLLCCNADHLFEDKVYRRGVKLKVSRDVMRLENRILIEPGFKQPAHRNLRVSEGVKNLLR